ncbi:MAG: hypothetical protein M3383_03935 [Actinomycetota bacterium]|nr:hypothetical protein [Actinomycetota bacterium]
MTLSRHIPLSIHAGIETLAAPLVMTAPFMFDLAPAAVITCLVVGGMLLYLALQIPGPRRTIPLSAHAAYDYALAGFAVVAGLVIGAITGSWTPAILLVGIGATQVALTASTRFSVPRGAQ